MHAFIQRGLAVVDGGLPGVVINRRGFQHGIGRTGENKIGHGLRHGLFRQDIQHLAALNRLEGARQVDPTGIDRAAVMPGDDAGDDELQFELFSQGFFFCSSSRAKACPTFPNPTIAKAICFI